MSTFPQDLSPSDGPQRTEIICPDCSGTIVVHAEGRRGMLVFKCKVGHLYNVPELLVGKEQHIENTMWAAIYAYTELAEILEDLAGRELGAGLSHADRERRRTRAAEMARGLRELLERDTRITLEPTDASPEPPR